MTCNHLNLLKNGHMVVLGPGALVDNVIYGRGATDNKGGLLAFNKAAKAFLKVRGEVPLNLKFFYEGEEEIGSVHLGPWVEKK